MKKIAAFLLCAALSIPAIAASPSSKDDAIAKKVVALPVVAEWVHSPDAKLSLTLGSETKVEGKSCRYAGVYDNASGSPELRQAFCVKGDKIWALSATDAYQPMTYDQWVKKCQPTKESAGNCE